MPGSYLLPLDQGNLLSHLRMLLDSCNHPGRIGPAARALQIPGNWAVSVLSYLRCGYDVAVIGALIHHILVIFKPIKISRDGGQASMPIALPFKCIAFYTIIQ
jgi:hypothetical protein